ncbi:hypothetical protein OEZ85_012690 [Tetradesmus obliquus]|uniref:Uncharacterized protein n=1 Tax=Tetradesmus obliquus TaxID=3088 RepID=A0ABY8U8I2_TETOB|nr:hypothetical protein OEZ85_012690 [Tetradesmus obliquus]
MSGSTAAARKRLSMTDGNRPPPSAVAPYLAGPAVASFVAKRTTQKAELVQYLEAHSGSVRAILNSGDGTTADAAQQQQLQQAGTDECWYGNAELPLRGSDACVSPCAVVNSTAGMDALFNGSGSTYRRSSQVASPTAAAPGSTGSLSPSSAAARRASVSAYLQGQQDLATTVSTGVPYLDSTGSSPRSPELLRASDVAAGGGGAGQPVASNSNSSRHTVIKEALAARLSDAAARASYAGPGSSSPRMHDEVSGIRQSLLAEGRARRASTTAVAGSSNTASQAAAMIARRLSNAAIYPGAYDATAALGNSGSNYDSQQQSWEAANFGSFARDEQGRVKVGDYGSMGSLNSSMAAAGQGFAENFAGNFAGQQGTAGGRMVQQQQQRWWRQWQQQWQEQHKRWQQQRASGAMVNGASLRRGSAVAARRSSSGGLGVQGSGGISAAAAGRGEAGREASWVASVVRRLSGVAPGGMGM